MTDDDDVEWRQFWEDMDNAKTTVGVEVVDPDIKLPTSVPLAESTIDIGQMIADGASVAWVDDDDDVGRPGPRGSTSSEVKLASAKADD